MINYEYKNSDSYYEPWDRNTRIWHHFSEDSERLAFSYIKYNGRLEAYFSASNYDILFRFDGGEDFDIIGEWWCKEVKFVEDIDIKLILRHYKSKLL